MELFHEIIRGSEAAHTIQQYPLIILSETISNKEISEILSYVETSSQAIVRKVYQEPTPEEDAQLKELGIVELVEKTCSVSILREKLSVLVDQLAEASTQAKVNGQSKGAIEKIEQFEERLSTKEQTFFHCLIESDQAIISREALGHYIWHEKPNKSHLSQLSSMLKKMKVKLRDSGIEDTFIETVWGEGYRLSESIYLLS